MELWIALGGLTYVVSLVVAYKLGWRAAPFEIASTRQSDWVPAKSLWVEFATTQGFEIIVLDINDESMGCSVVFGPEGMWFKCATPRGMADTRDRPVRLDDIRQGINRHRLPRPHAEAWRVEGREANR